MRQYRIMLDALKLRNVDQAYWKHLQAYLNYAVQATKQHGKHVKPVYSTFDKFFDYEGEIRRAKGEPSKKESRFADLSHFLANKKKEKDNA